jgi:hypothetical protein
VSLKDRLDRIFDVSSYGYVVNKWFLRVAFFIMLCLFLIVVRVDGWDVAVYGSSAFICPVDQFLCVNPYVPLDCDYSYLYGGEVYGLIPSGLAQLFPYLCVGLFAFALLLNHLIYNKNFRVKTYEKN